MKYTKEELLPLIVNDTLTFELEVDWQDTSYHKLNNIVDEKVEDGYNLGDITYEAVSFDPEKSTMIVKVICSDLHDYLNSEED
jgi:hypothetical protein